MTTRDDIEDTVRWSTLHKTLAFAAAVIVSGVTTAFAVGQRSTEYPTKGDVASAVKTAINRYDHGTEGDYPDFNPRPAVIQTITEHSARMDRLERTSDEVHGALVMQLRWQVSQHAAEAEPNRLKRSQSARKAARYFDELIAKGTAPAESARRALETIPYE